MCLMDFGKLPNVDRVDFTLPPDPDMNHELLAALTPRRGPGRILIGPTGYNMKAWVGKWYPHGAKDKQFLEHYGAQFDTIEFNVTHYRIPDYATVARWYESVPADFRFAPKFPQTISHANDLGVSSGQIPVFIASLMDLKEKLGCSFIQLPPRFSPRETPVFDRFLDHLPDNFQLAVEVRHPDFFKENAAAEVFFDLLQARNIATVITDVAGRRDVAHMRLSNQRVLIRFVGNDFHASDYTRIDDWASRLQQWFREGLHEAYFFCHEPDNLLGPELSELCYQRFKSVLPDVQMRSPKMVDQPAAQGSLFDF